jgi:hypothetical protein
LQHTDKQHVLEGPAGLDSMAAAVALNAGKEPIYALELLESGRGIIYSLLMDIRGDLSDLQEQQPELADKFIHFRDQLEPPVAHSNPFIDENCTSSWQVQESRRYAGEELDKLIVKIRKLPEFEDFLLAPSEGQMQVAAKRGPIVAINVSEYRCDAILIEQHQIRSLALPLLDIKVIKEKALSRDLASLEVLEWLWDTVTSPILDALGFTQPPSEDDWPHMWWIPIGPLSKFPLHAAGRHIKGSSETVLDRVMSSYSSSVKAIIHGRRRAVIESFSAQALLVAMENTPEQTRLLYANKEIEIIRSLVKAMSFDLIEPGRRKQIIISHLPQCKIFHFAGHGYTDEKDPSKSHLLLEDGKSDPLTVATLLEMNLREHSPFLAYLSACGTGRIKNERLVDESIHLISAYQLAGFRHVIGTLWEVNDKACVDMARITYEGMRDGGMTDESVCLGLHRASRELRNRWLSGPSKTTWESRSVKQDIFLSDDETGIGSVHDGYKRGDKLPRKASLCESDGEDGWPTGPPHWVPYIHFGV